MIFAIYLSLFAAVIFASTDNDKIKAVAFVVIIIATAIANCSYFKLKIQVSKNKDFLNSTAEFLLSTSKRVGDLMKAVYKYPDPEETKEERSDEKDVSD